MSAAAAMPLPAAAPSASVAHPASDDVDRRSSPRAAVLLLKERVTEGDDPYEQHCIRHGLQSHFLPPLHFSFIDSAIDSLAARLSSFTPSVAAPHPAVVATSPRGLQAWIRVLRAIADRSPQACAHWSRTTLFVLSEASAKTVRDDEWAAAHGVVPTIFPGVTCATELAPRLRKWWAQHKPAGTLLALPGDRRRDELYIGLAAPTESESEAVVPVTEVTVYRTHCASVDAADDESDPSAVEPLMSDLLRTLSSIPPSLPVFVALFSPTGCDAWSSQLRRQARHIDMQRRLLRLEPVSACPLPPENLSDLAARFHYAAIGHTTATHFRALSSASSSSASSSPLSPIAVSQLIVAPEPNADSLIQCIAARLDDLLSVPVAPSLVSIPFYKLHASLNDYVLLDGFIHSYTREQIVRLTRAMCLDRRGAIGADGLLLVTDASELSDEQRATLPPETQLHGRMQMFNPDGSEAEMCGNGLRCVVKFIHDHKYRHTPLTTLNVWTGAGLKVADVSRDPVTGLASTLAVDLGRPRLDPVSYSFEHELGRFDCHDVSMGNPHCIVLLSESEADAECQRLWSLDVERVGPAIQRQARYPQGVNVSFVQVARASETGLQVHIRTFERGAGETACCGSGVGASVSSVVSRMPHPPAVASSASEAYEEVIRVRVRGGDLSVRARFAPPSAAPLAAAESTLLRDVTSVELRGDAHEVFQGTFQAKIDV